MKKKIKQKNTSCYLYTKRENMNLISNKHLKLPKEEEIGFKRTGMNIINYSFDFGIV